MQAHIYKTLMNHLSSKIGSLPTKYPVIFDNQAKPDNVNSFVRCTLVPNLTNIVLLGLDTPNGYSGFVSISLFTDKAIGITDALDWVDKLSIAVPKGSIDNIIIGTLSILRKYEADAYYQIDLSLPYVAIV